MRFIKIVPFIGAGWACPYVRFWKWGVGIYFHCGRGLYIGIGWSNTWRNIKRTVKAMTPEEREQLRQILGDSLNKAKS